MDDADLKIVWGMPLCGSSTKVDIAPAGVQDSAPRPPSRRGSVRRDPALRSRIRGST